jgi:protein-S-isoprenylcysteine O-methyltransferase Ste14
VGGKKNAASIGRSAILIAIGLVFSTVLFAIAGRLDWLEGWLLAGAVMVYMGGSAVMGIVRDPELIKERSTAISSSRGIERAILIFVFVLCAAVIAVAALDAGRFRWSVMPVIVEALGWLLVLPALAFPMWVGMVNTFASAVVRVQKERGHHVIAEGPYRHIRHPMYAGTVLMGVGIPLALGSWWALIPGVLWSVTFVLRTAQEDAALKRDLPGYAEYVRKVQYRLMPGIW